MTPDTNVLGLIAAEGRLPFLVAQGAKKQGMKVICVGLARCVSRQLTGEVDTFYEVPIARPGSWIRRLKKHHVTKAVMVGTIAKRRLFTPFRILRYLPDRHALKIWYWTLRKKNKQNETLLAALAGELAGGGIILEDSTMYCREHMATKAVLTKHPVPQWLKDDIDFGWPIVKKLAELDIGQAVAIKEKEVIAIEAIEGTAKMIERAGQYCKKGRWTLIKTSKPNQDMRFDVPCVGPDTIKSLAENGGKCLVVEAEKTIIIDKPQTIELADKLGITILGR